MGVNGHEQEINQIRYLLLKSAGGGLFILDLIRDLVGGPDWNGPGPSSWDWTVSIIFAALFGVFVLVPFITTKSSLKLRVFALVLASILIPHVWLFIDEVAGFAITLLIWQFLLCTAVYSGSTGSRRGLQTASQCQATVERSQECKKTSTCMLMLFVIGSFTGCFHRYTVVELPTKSLTGYSILGISEFETNLDDAKSRGLASRLAYRLHWAVKNHREKKSQGIFFEEVTLNTDKTKGVLLMQGTTIRYEEGSRAKPYWIQSVDASLSAIM